MTTDRTKNPLPGMASADLNRREWTPGRWLSFDPFNNWWLPALPGVYVFFLDNEPVYVGQTRSLKHRLWQHRFEYTFGNSQKTPWGTFGAEVSVTGKLKVSRRYGDWAMQELRLIRALSPRFNLLHKKRAAANG